MDFVSESRELHSVIDLERSNNIMLLTSLGRPFSS